MLCILVQASGVSAGVAATSTTIRTIAAPGAGRPKAGLRGPYAWVPDVRGEEAMPGCPNCGGAQRRAIAPRYWECQTINVVGMAQGQQPVTSVCGHLYQEGPFGGQAAERCGCGMYAGERVAYAIWPCADRMGRLSTVSFFATFTGRNQARKRHEAAELERERELGRKRARRDRAAQLPGFPADGPASSAVVATALQALVPEQKRTFVLKRGRWNRVTKTLEGWAFYKNSSRREGSYGYYDEASGWLIDTAGGLWTWNAAGKDITALSNDLSGVGRLMGGQEAIVSDADLSTIRSQLNQWRGIGVQHWL